MKLIVHANRRTCQLVSSRLSPTQAILDEQLSAHLLSTAPLGAILASEVI